jgi:hypothetical protein
VGCLAEQWQGRICGHEHARHEDTRRAMTNFLARSIVVAPAAIAFYGRIHGQTYSGIDVWPSSADTPTTATAEYAFTPDPNKPYIAFFHTTDAKPTLLYYDADGNYNADKALDCVDATHYGAVVWTEGTKELIVNTAKKSTGFHLADINYQGTVDFASAVVSLTADPVTWVIPSDIRIDTNGHCSLLQRNDYYVTEVSVADDLSLTLEHSAIQTLYSSGAEFLFGGFELAYNGEPTIEDSMLTLTARAVIRCNYEPDTVPVLTIQWGGESTVNTPPDAWNDYAPTDPAYDQPNVTVTGSMLTSVMGSHSYVWVRCKVVYGSTVLYGYQQRLLGTPEMYTIWNPETPGWDGYGYREYHLSGGGVAVSITGTRTLLYRTQFGPEGGVVDREIVRTYTAVPAIDSDPNPTSNVARIVERDWTDFWAEPTVIVSDTVFSTGASDYNAFVSQIFADGSIGLAYDLFGTPHLFVFTDAWAEITLPDLPAGYTYSAIGSLVELPQPCLVVVVDGPDSTNGIGIYDIGAGTWTMQCSKITISYVYGGETDRKSVV